MYAPLAFDLLRTEQEQLRRRVERAPRWSEPTGSAVAGPSRRSRALRRSHRRTAAAC
jgi:hypothetical protein